MYKVRLALANILLVGVMVAATPLAHARKPATAQGCYRNTDPVVCFLALAEGKLPRIAGVADRADALEELLYAMAVTGHRNEAILTEARALADNPALRPAKQMDLLYAADLYALAPESYEAALRRFGNLVAKLEGDELAELHAGACAIVAWDGTLRERWLEFAASVCTPAGLAALKPNGTAYKALVLAMMPVALALAEDRDGFALAANQALAWLDDAERIAKGSKGNADREFVAYMGVLIHTLNSLCLDAFDFADASDAEVERARLALARIEARTGITGRLAYLRRMVIESLFDTGREAEAKKMLRQLLARIDADPKGSRISLPEQLATLLLAARLEHRERDDEEEACTPGEATRI